MSEFPVPLWLLLASPWLAVALYIVLRVRLPPELPPPAVRPEGSDGGAGDAAPWPPLVSVVVPARDEAHNIERVLETVAASRWPRFEIVVVDDRSTDGTGEIARTVAPGHAERIAVVDGAPLPDGWTGKPWACWQGAAEARGELLLFTDADTVHGPDLLARAVAGLEAEGADVITVAGRQLMETFWERLVQPQIFMSMIGRYPDMSKPLPRDRWRDAIANGQFMLFRADVYREMRGHEAVRDEIVEDLRLAQMLVREGWRFRVFVAEDAFATRMYRSLGELIAGWSKNIVLGGLSSLPPWLRPITPPAMLLVGAALWLVPPAALAAGLLGVAQAPALAWGATVVAISVAYWCVVSARFGVAWWYGALYPLGAAVGWWIVLRSWIRMARPEWKGRRYEAALPVD